MLLGKDAAQQPEQSSWAPLLPQIDDPQLQGMARLTLAWILPIRGDYERAAGEAVDALELLRAHDEPYWTGLAGASLAGITERDAVAVARELHAAGAAGS